MAYQVLSEKRANTQGVDGTVFLLQDQTSGTIAEIWPAMGFNCYRWQAAVQGQTLDLLYADPDLFAGSRPTRSGIPILFPFPNRIRGGRFSWQGKDYQLPCNDPVKMNAIHGFACRSVWRVVDQGADATGAWLTGEFQTSVDAPDARDHWPADQRLRLTYRLSALSLRLEATVTNPAAVPLPFGLGYHPYFRVPFLPGTTAADYQVDCPARQYWELEENLPTGQRLPVADGRDLTIGKRFVDLQLDDAFTGLTGGPNPAADALCWRGQLRETRHGTSVQLLTSPAFGELVAFTPPHRQAVCLEPYTCTTDAINLQQQGHEAGLLVLEPGADWRGVVEMRLVSAPT